MNLADRVRTRRKELGMSQEELALRMGYKSRVSVNKIEMGRPISQKIIVKLADALGTTPSYLMGWDQPLEEDLMEIISLYNKLNDDQRQVVKQMMEVMVDDR